MVPQNSRNTKRQITWIILSACVGVALLSFLVPAVSTVQQPFAAHLRTAIALLAALPFMAAAIWFMVSLGLFKSGVRFAYRMFGIGMILFAAGIAQLPILGLFDLWNTAWAQSGAVAVIFIAGAALMYVAMCKLAKLLHIRGLITSVWFVVSVAFVFAVLTYFVSPFLVQYHNVKDVESYLAAVGFAAIFMTAGPIVTSKVKRAIGESYSHAMKILLAAQWVLAFEGWHEYIQSYFMNNGTPYNDYGFYMWPFVLTAFIMLFASEAFARITVVPSLAVQTSEFNDREYIDSIITTAALASQPGDIDEILVGLRGITARLSSDTSPLTAEDKKELLEVYAKLETYLTSGRDPLRTFSRDEIRARLNEHFVAVLK